MKFPYYQTSVESQDLMCAFLPSFIDSLKKYPELQRELEQIRKKGCWTFHRNQDKLSVPFAEAIYRFSYPNDPPISTTEGIERQEALNAAFQNVASHLSKETLEDFLVAFYTTDPTKVYERLYPNLLDARAKSECNRIRTNLKSKSMSHLLDLLVESSPFQDVKSTSIQDIQKECQKSRDLTDQQKSYCDFILRHPCITKLAPEELYAPSGLGEKLAHARFHTRAFS
jgi:hypothetical protein